MAPLRKITPLTLTGRFVRLEPLSEAHVPGLTAIGMDDEIWQFDAACPDHRSARWKISGSGFAMPSSPEMNTA